jgi:MPBQ/MSBQ methyltransferase
MKINLALAQEDLAEVESNLRRQYQGVFDEKLIALHIREFIESSLADRMAAVIARQMPPGASLLDVGCGYGAFVLASRAHGLDAQGFELAPFEVAVARRRLARVEPGTDPIGVFHQGHAGRLPFADGQFDAVTLFNVLEHVQDYRPVLMEAFRVLRPGGRMYVICPNYAAIRQEAHYHVPWPPLLPRGLAVRYLRMLGRNPTFFQEHIHYRTNWGVLAALRSMGLQLSSMDILRLDYPELISSPRAKALFKLLDKLHLLPLVRILLAMNLHNPLKAAVSVVAIKGRAT